MIRFSLSLILTFNLYGFKFCVLGDRTPLASKDLFETVMKELAVIKPDFVIHLGNLIRGRIKDTIEIKKEWEYISKRFSSLGIPYHFCPGSEDIWDEKSEEIYLRYFNKTYYSFDYNNCHFLLLDFSRFPKYSDVPKEMIDWLREDLAQARRAKHTFLFGHRPYWRVLKEKWGLHGLLKRHRVRYFFSGADCFYTYHFMDSIHYFQVGPTGARLKWETDEERGGFPNYLLVEVEKNQVKILLIRPGSILPPDFVTLKAIEQEEVLESKAIFISPFNLRGEAGREEIGVSLTNPFSYEIKGEIRWLPYSWEVSPPKAKFYLEPRGKGFFPFTITTKGEIFPLPKFIFSYPKEEGKEEVITKSLPLKRAVTITQVSPTPVIDGELREWQTGLSLFSDEKGEKSKLNSNLFFGFDTVNLYFGLRNYEKQIKARVREQDGQIKEDDFASFFLSLTSDTIFEISINPFGFIADGRYVKERERYRRREWRGRYQLKTKVGSDHWQLEMALPFSNFFKGDPKELKRLGFNLLRYSPDDSLALFFQPPSSPIRSPKLFPIGEEGLGALILRD